mmetsp:Transcript_30207/g.64000  ORF Transcript_30207/g.64000 Transcript_30207/m.64000 type:complete len:712 (-) Transcript_30207:295-2430(-)|eukprot:CAMPEP_0172314086 /NCGR_PEP_ID=MMETSP1058-20130122/21625_1 /TAXON_ID=83371 /ORGANISM="Detonula confervacea, Strain CCMP 353" /LENGTH=711 /DNA_ID=CAMNT_0013027851 /DNA_START=240 /DNA_END=2375 /DNA_ORIENTATION=+
MTDDKSDDGHGGTMDLYSLLSQTINDWSFIYHHIQSYPHKARDRFYRESPLQLALKAREQINRESSNEGGKHVERMHVLQALVDADPSSIHSRDEEGRTPVHAACAAGRSSDILQWLITVEESLGKTNGELLTERNVTLRTDYPGGALPLHSVSACHSFDCTSLECEIPQLMGHPMKRYSPNVISAYYSTTIIWQAHPAALWDRDCEGEIPLHAAASWGNLGAVFSLLIGAAVSEDRRLEAAASSVARAALTADDRNKTPLDRACERLSSLCVHVRESERYSMNYGSSLRRSITREDPFQQITTTVASSNANEGRRSLLHSSRIGSGQRRIPGCGSSFRSSFSSPFVGGGSMLDIREYGISDELLERTSSYPPRLRASFISPRRSIDTIRGLEPLDRDGDEELEKIEMLARAALGFFEVGNMIFPSTEAMPTPLAPSELAVNTNKSFRLLHAVILLDCEPEIVWHAAAKHPHQVGEKDEFGRVPLFLACERLAALYSRHNEKRRLILTKETKESTENDRASTVSNEVTHGGKEETKTEDAIVDSEGSRFVQSLILGGDCSYLLDNATRFTQSTQSQQEAHPSLTVCNNDRLELSQEVINILLHSPKFGKPEMASVPDAGGRLALHIILEAGMKWVDDDVYGCSGNKEGNHLHYDSTSYNVVQSLVDSCPRALEIKDGNSGLLPFMVAATPNALWDENDIENDECTKKLETV